MSSSELAAGSCELNPPAPITSRRVRADCSTGGAYVQRLSGPKAETMHTGAPLRYADRDIPGAYIDDAGVSAGSEADVGATDLDLGATLVCSEDAVSGAERHVHFGLAPGIETYRLYQD
jgi:hypothetical protein